MKLFFYFYFKNFILIFKYSLKSKVNIFSFINKKKKKKHYLKVIRIFQFF